MQIRERPINQVAAFDVVAEPAGGHKHDFPSSVPRALRHEAIIRDHLSQVGRPDTGRYDGYRTARNVKTRGHSIPEFGLRKEDIQDGLLCDTLLRLAVLRNRLVRLPLLRGITSQHRLEMIHKRERAVDGKERRGHRIAEQHSIQVVDEVEVADGNTLRQHLLKLLRIKY